MLASVVGAWLIVGVRLGSSVEMVGPGVSGPAEIDELGWLGLEEGAPEETTQPAALSARSAAVANRVDLRRLVALPIPAALPFPTTPQQGERNQTAAPAGP